MTSAVLTVNQAKIRPILKRKTDFTLKEQRNWPIFILNGEDFCFSSESSHIGDPKLGGHHGCSEYKRERIGCAERTDKKRAFNEHSHGAIVHWPTH
jgi:hypothetical protein